MCMRLQLQQARDKLDTSRLESLTDSEETLAELRKRHEREMKMVTDDNRKLLADLEVLSENNRRMQTERMQMDSDYEELRYRTRGRPFLFKCINVFGCVRPPFLSYRSKRQAIAQWERQISEIIQWVSDEKDARGYLQALASKMTEEIEYVKLSGSLHQNASDKNWRNRRSQKLDKMELLNLQSSLQSEIQAKAAIAEELSRTRADLVAAQKYDARGGGCV